MQTVDISLRSDHLEAVIAYALQQVQDTNGEVNPLEFGDNENAIGVPLDGQSTLSVNHATEDLIAALEGMLLAVKTARGDHHCDLMPIPYPQHFRPLTAITR